MSAESDIADAPRTLPLAQYARLCLGLPDSVHAEIADEISAASRTELALSAYIVGEQIKLDEISRLIGLGRSAPASQAGAPQQLASHKTSGKRESAAVPDPRPNR